MHKNLKHGLYTRPDESCMIMIVWGVSVRSRTAEGEGI
jgi:hypothetical protein